MANESSEAVSQQQRPPWELALLIVLGVLWFSLLGYRDLNEPDEGRYAEIPREMVVSGEWMTPRLDGFNYFEKPPLHYWATAFFYQQWGVHAASSRLWGALMGFVGILWVIRVGSRLFGATAGWYAGMILASLFLYGALGHFNTLDMSTSVWLMLGMGALMVAQTERDNNPRACRNNMLLAWAALAGACLSKGVIGLLLPGASLILYTLWQRDWGLWRHMQLKWGILLFLLLSAPWFVAVSQLNPEFLHFFFIHEHLERYTQTAHGRGGTGWYFIGVLLLGSMPWSHRSVVVLLRPGFTERAGGFDPVRLLWVYMVFILCFFSLSQSKLIPYILPLFPPLALLLGRHLSRDGALAVGWESRMAAILAVSLLAAGMQVPLFAN
ncbi:MAG: glycosyltransferase family 39 protein, partial [Magnetococcales bacterium]|nr:glycosyltransferase family 39 protein [Magnetococcales bacterium]